jgi:hypothetical protein
MSPGCLLNIAGTKNKKVYVITGSNATPPVVMVTPWVSRWVITLCRRSRCVRPMQLVDHNTVRSSTLSRSSVRLFKAMFSFCNSLLPFSNQRKTRARYGSLISGVRLDLLLVVFTVKTDSGVYAVIHDGKDTTMKEGDGDDQSREYPCIVRVTDGKKAKFSTKVHDSLLQGSTILTNAPPLGLIKRP